MSDVETSFGIIGIAANGTPDGELLLFLHGVGSTKELWKPQLDHFTGRRAAIAVDYPGYGESEFRPDATRDDFAHAALAAMEAMGRERAHICGLSLGGAVAIAMHHLAPERCASLIIADSFAVHPDGQAIYDRSVAASRAMTMRELAEARTGVLVGQAATQELRAEVIETMAAIDPAAYRIGAKAVWLADQRDRVAKINCPTLILVGDEDCITPPALSEELHRMIPGSRLEQIAGAGHLSNAEQPQAFNRAIESFLAELG
jgi:3-oxoadipate enol-lactonase